MKYKYCLAILFVWKSMFAFGQTVPAGTEMQELVRIAEVYANMSDLSFDLRYTYADSLTWHDFTDSLSATCKISYGRSFITNGEIEILAGSEYNVFVDKEDSIIMVSRRHDYKSIFQIPLLDSVFMEAHVSGMNIIKIDDSTWKLNVFFNPGSYYLTYEMLYDPNDGLIKSVNYHARNEAGDNSIPADHIICAFVYMSNYSYAVQDPVLFNENRYFYLLNGAMYLQPAWQQFQFQN